MLSTTKSKDPWGEFLTFMSKEISQNGALANPDGLGFQGQVFGVNLNSYFDFINRRLQCALKDDESLRMNSDLSLAEEITRGTNAKY